MSGTGTDFTEPVVPGHHSNSYNQFFESSPTIRSSQNTDYLGNTDYNPYASPTCFTRGLEPRLNDNNFSQRRLSSSYPDFASSVPQDDQYALFSDQNNYSPAQNTHWHNGVAGQPNDGDIFGASIPLTTSRCQKCGSPIEQVSAISESIAQTQQANVPIPDRTPSLSSASASPATYMPTQIPIAVDSGPSSIAAVEPPMTTLPTLRQSQTNATTRARTVRQRVKLLPDSFRPVVEEFWNRDKNTMRHVLEMLRTDYNLRISERTLKRRCKNWGLRKYR